MYCTRCRWHQHLYRAVVVVLVAALLWFTSTAHDLALELAPFADKKLHAAIAGAVELVAAALCLLAINLVPSEPGHGHWGEAVRHSKDGTHTLYRRASYGRAVADVLGDEVPVREVREPRSGWRLAFVFVTVIPVLAAVRGYCHYDPHRLTLYVDNGTDSRLRISIDGDELASVPSQAHRAIELPRRAMTLVATDTRTGKEVERLSVGGLDEILADRYSSLYPDIEYDTANTFVWNVLRRHCYKASTHMYGTMSLGGDSELHREKAFASETDKPFTVAPSVVTSPLPMDVRNELLRHPCE